MYLEELAESIHETARAKGFYSDVDGAPVKIDDNLVGMKLALIHSEVTEILEAIRKSQGTDAISDEFADVLIRLLDLYEAISREGLYGRLKPLSEAIAAKTAKNTTRQHKHGNRF